MDGEWSFKFIRKEELEKFTVHQKLKDIDVISTWARRDQPQET